MQAVNPANISTGNGNLEENGLYALLISRQEEIIGLVKPLIVAQANHKATRYSTNAIILLFEVSC